MDSNVPRFARGLIGIGVILLLAAGCTASTTSTTASPIASGPTATSSTTTQEETTMLDATSVEVTFPAKGIDLVGTLRLPAGDGPFPTVVLIAGSGPESRDEVVPGQLDMTFGFEIPVFKELAEGLQGNGIAVLTYDKRTCGPFNGCADNGYPIPQTDLTVDDFVADATSAVEYLRTRPEVDASRITIIGHSQGAEFITVMLAADPELASGVMIGGPYRPIDQIIETQLDFTVQLIEQQGMTEEQALALPPVASLAEMVDGVKAIRAGGTEPVAGTSAEFWNSWFDLHESTLSSAAEMTQPLLVLNGEMDWNVPATEAESWRQYLDSIDANAEVQTLPCVTHALNCVQGTNPLAITPADIGRNIAPEVVDAIVRFLGE
jgi:hypothetical protein